MKKYSRQVQAYLVLGVSLLMTATASYYMHRSIETADAYRFNRRAALVQSAFENKLQTYVNALIQTRALFVAEGAVSRDRFRAYIKSIDLNAWYPGALGIGYAVRIDRKDHRYHTGEVRRAGFLRYKIWPDEKKTESFPVVFLEPLNSSNKRALGFDMATEPEAAKAMERARDEGVAAATGKIDLAWGEDSKSEPGFSIYVPVYRNGARIATLEQRRKALVGFVYASLVARECIEAITQQVDLTDARIDLEVFDHSQADFRHLIYDRESSTSYSMQGVPSRFSRVVEIRLAGQPWHVHLHSLPDFESRSLFYAPVLIFLFGIIVSLLLFRMLLVADRYTEVLQKNEKQLVEQAEFLSTLNRVGQTISAELDLQKLIQVVIDAAKNLTGAQFGAFAYSVPGEESGSTVLHASSGRLPSTFGASRATHLADCLDPVFNLPGTVHSSDVTHDKRLIGRIIMTPSSSLRSYLAVSLTSRSGEILGRVMLGHHKRGVFTERHIQLVEGLASQANVALDNARLYCQAQEAIEHRDEFLSIASHELKTPLTTLKLRVQSLSHIIDKDPKLSSVSTLLRQMCDTADNQVERILRLVNELLDVTRIQAGKLSLEREPVDLSKMVREIVERFSCQFEEANCDVELFAKPGLVGQVDPSRFDQVVTNLISNAIKYAPGKPIKVSVEESADKARLEVRDHGIGIEKEDQGRIFNRFERAVSSQHFGGLGLGLYICRRIIEAHGGKMGVSSELGAGSTFYVEVPLKSRSELVN